MHNKHVVPTCGRTELQSVLCGHFRLDVMHFRIGGVLCS